MMSNCVDIYLMEVSGESKAGQLGGKNFIYIFWKSYLERKAFFAKIKKENADY